MELNIVDIPHKPISPYSIPRDNIVQLHPRTLPYKSVTADVYVGHKFIQVQTFQRDEYYGACQINFVRNPVFVNIMDPDNGQVVLTLTPGLRE